MTLDVGGLAVQGHYRQEQTATVEAGKRASSRVAPHMQADELRMTVVCKDMPSVITARQMCNTSVLGK
jgi:hypothetical protein